MRSRCRQTERDVVRARPEQLLGELGGEADSVGSVLAVDDAEVDAELDLESRKPFLERPPPRRAEHVSDEEDPQRTSF